MTPLSLNVQTLIADLAQSLGDCARTASVHTKSVRGKAYLYAREKTAGRFRDRALGPADDAQAQRRAEEVRHAGTRARARRKLVTLLKRAGVPAPSGILGRCIAALADAGLFAKGMVLIGTGAYQIFPGVVGAILSAGALQTQDLDLAVAHLGISDDTPLLDVLRSADPTFLGVPGLDGRDAPKKFLTADGFAVELLTPVRTRKDRDSLPLPGIGAAATPMQFLPYLLADAIRAAALIGSGVTVTVPQPARYAVHKLIVAQRRPPGNLKRAKDLVQAAELMAALARSDPTAFDAALRDARAKGREWRRLIDASLNELAVLQSPERGKAAR